MQAAAAGTIWIEEGSSMYSTISDYAEPVLKLAEATIAARPVESVEAGA